LPETSPGAGLRPRRLLLPPLLFGALALAATWKALLLGQVFYFRDLLSHHVPHLALGARMWRSGEVPLWSPLFDAGQPHLANPQNLALHPLQILYFLLPADRAFALSLFLLFALAGLAMYACARSLGASRAGALAAGAAFQCSGFILSLGNLANLLATAAPLPLTFLFAARCARRLAAGTLPARRAALADLAGGAGCFALQILGGEPFVAALSLAGVALSVLVAAPGGSARAVAASAAAVAGVAVLAPLLCAAVLVPAAAFYPETVRAWGFRPQGALQWSLRPIHLIEMLVPGFFGNPLARAPDGFWGAPLFDRGRPFILGIGIAASALAAAAAAIRDAFARDPDHPVSAAGGSAAGETAPEEIAARETASDDASRPALLRGLAWSAAAFTLLAFGRHGILRLEWLDQVRSLPLLRYPVRFFLVPTFALCLLSAFGLEAVAAGRRRIHWGRLCLGGCAGLATAAAATAAMAAGGAPPGAEALSTETARSVASALARSSFFWGIAALILLPPERGAWGAPRRAAALAALAALDPLSAYHGLNPAGPRSLLLRPPEVVGALRSDPDRFRVWRDNSPRLEGLAHLDAPFLAETVWFRDTLHPSYGMEFDLAYAFNTSGDESDSQRTFLLGRRVAAAAPAQRARILGIAGVKYLLAFEPPADPTLEEARRFEIDGPDLHLWRNRLWIPTVRVVERAFPAPGGQAALERLLSPEHDPLAEVILEGPLLAGPTPGPARAAPPGTAEPARGPTACAGGPEAAIEVERPAYLRIRACAPREGYLVLSDRYSDGWRVTLDGAPAPLFRAEYLFRAVAVPPGEHQVEFRYRPASVRAGALGSLAGFATAACLIAAGLHARRRLAGSAPMC
jgi:hypothetical protein